MRSLLPLPTICRVSSWISVIFKFVSSDKRIPQFKNNVNNYKKYEDKLITATKNYVNANKMYPKKGSKLYVKIGDLITGGYVSKKDIVDGCSGTIIVKYDEFIDYVPNLKCKYYKSINK